MASNFLIGFLFGIGVGGWVYSKVIRSTGGNTKNSLVAAGVAALFAMLILTTLLSAFIKR